MKYFLPLLVLSVLGQAYGSEYTCLGLRNSESLQRSYKGPSVVINDNEQRIGTMAEFDVSLQETEDTVFLLLKDRSFTKVASGKKGYVKFFEYSEKGTISVSCTRLEDYSSI